MTEPSRDSAGNAPEPPGEHRFAIRVYYADTDAGGIVYHANYLGFLERARTEMLRERGVTHAGLLREYGLAMAVADCSIRYVRPARLDDALMVHTLLGDIRGATLHASQTVTRDGEVLVRADLRIACIDRDGRPRRVPGSLISALGRPVPHPRAGGDVDP